ncbi:GPW/gp25 family protein [Terriglobus albidus]|uniref:GPW/gp25 family protein n=1 Tax=Terriglobus albidus TaxID=1592106 RepID=A0A5B9EGW1_9BACT|nr:GPW/gp25 family protein [Terriglobus albidus]QEE29661.1 GPW/gp25 family protein [Terriglobus albidus]
MSIDFLGVGWSFPVEIADGGVRLTAYESSVRQSIWTILSTAHGERVMRPDFGSGLSQLVFAPNNAATASLAAYEVRLALEVWERRIELLALDVRPASNGAVLEIHLLYRILRTNSRYNLVYPFYLQGRA